MLKIGNLELKAPFFQAPLSGYTDRPMRVLAKEYGAPLTFTGVLLDQIALHPKAIRKLLSIPGDDERPVGAQILGATPETMAKAAFEFEKLKFDVIDLNFACPAPKVLRRGRGGAMLKKPEIAIETFKRVRDSVKCPVSVKLRIGFEANEGVTDNFWQICEGLAENGVDMLCIHGRTVKQMYREKADWDVLAKVKQRFPDTPIVGSGDVMSAESALQRYERTGIDGILFARGAIGNPWIFSDAKALFAGEAKPAPPTIRETGEILLRHFEMTFETKREPKAIGFFRKFMSGYSNRHPQRKRVLVELMACKRADEIRTLVDEYFFRD